MAESRYQGVYGTLGVTERGFCWNRWPKPPLTAHGGAPPSGEPYVVGITILHTEIYFAQKRIFLRAVEDVGPYRFVRFFYKANRYLFCKKEDFIKVGLKDEEKIL